MLVPHLSDQHQCVQAWEQHPSFPRPVIEVSTEEGELVNVIVLIFNFDFMALGFNWFLFLDRY